MKKIIVLSLIVVMLSALMLPVFADSELSITMQPQNPTYPEYSVASYSVKATGSNLMCTWYLEYQGKTYNISDNTNGFEPWEAYAGENYGGVQDGNTFTWFFSGIEAGLNGAEIWCVIEDGHYDVISDRAIITIQGDAMPPEITTMPAQIIAYRGDSVDIRCVARSTDGSQLEYIWYETLTGKLQNIQAIYPEETGDYLLVSTESAGVRYYVCGITTSNGGRAYSGVVRVTVLDADPEYGPEMEILTKKLPDATVGQAYRAELQCNDPYGLFTLYYNPGRANQFEEYGLRLTKENVIVGTPAKAGTFTFSVCASGDYGEDYMEYTLTVKEAAKVPEATELAGTEPEVTDPAVSEVETEPNETDDPKNIADDEIEDTKPEETTKEKKSSSSEKNSDQQEFPWWGFILIGIASAAAGVGAAVLLLKKK